VSYLVDPGLPLALSLDNFIIGASNEKVHKICLEAIDQPKRYNPVIITGPNGCGKTHLMVALFRKTLLDYSSLRSLYLDGASLSRLLTYSREVELPNLDVLFIDDLQTLPPELEGPFLAFFDRSYHSQTQIFIALDRDLEKLVLSSSVKSRLLQALRLTMDNPDAQVRKEFIQRELYKRSGGQPDTSALNSILERSGGKSMREVLGLLQDCEFNGVPAVSVSKPGALTAPQNDSELFGFIFAPEEHIGGVSKDAVVKNLATAISSHHLPLGVSFNAPFFYNRLEDIGTLTGMWPLLGKKPDFAVVLMKPTETALEEEKFAESVSSSFKNLGVLPLIIFYRDREQAQVYLSCALELLMYSSKSSVA